MTWLYAHMLSQSIVLVLTCKQSHNGALRHWFQHICLWTMHCAWGAYVCGRLGKELNCQHTHVCVCTCKCPMLALLGFWLLWFISACFDWCLLVFVCQRVCVLERPECVRTTFVSLTTQCRFLCACRFCNTTRIQKSSKKTSHDIFLLLQCCSAGSSIILGNSDKSCRRCATLRSSWAKAWQTNFAKTLSTVDNFAKKSWKYNSLSFWISSRHVESTWVQSKSLM